MIDHNNLEEFADPHVYDIEDNSDTGIAFYTALAQETGGPVLEIACGTGRVSIPIARLGFAVTGLDIVPGMLARARSKSAGLPARWVEGDARAFDLGEHFRLIFVTGNAFQAFLTRADQETLLARVRAHLHDEGLFAFETRNPRWASLTRAGPEAPLARGTAHLHDEGLFAFLETCAEEEDWQTYTDSSGREVRVAKTQAYDHVAQILHWTTYRRWRKGDHEQTQITRIAVRYTFPQELAALLYYNGFTIIRQYGDWNLEPLTAASPSIIVVCRKRAMPETEYLLHPIGFIRSPLQGREQAPKQGSEGAPDAWLEVNSAVAEGLEGIEVGNDIIVITWLHESRRDGLKLHPRGDNNNPLTGVFATRSPDRPNPLGLHHVTVLEIAGNRLRVGPIEAIDGTPVVDLKPVLPQSADS